MKKLIMGILLVVLGLPGTAYFFSDLIRLILGGLPLLLILGGGLAVYLGYEELQAEKDLESDIPDATDSNIPDDIPPSPLEPEKETEVRTSIEAPSPAAPEDDAGPGDDAGFAGNTDTLVFHSISCNFARGKHCTVRFASREEAIEQEFNPCKVCNP